MTAALFNAIVQRDNGATLYLGNWAATSDAAFTATLGAVINCTKAVHATLNEKNTKISFLRIDMPRDGVDKYPRAFAFIDAALDAGCNVLVHCAAGACRSAAIVLFYLMKKNNWPLQKAHAVLRGKRPAVAALNEESLAKYAVEIHELLRQV